MPQMAPISWLILFFIFSCTFLIFNLMNYYCFFYSNKNNKIDTDNKKSVNNSMIWKW